MWERDKAVLRKILDENRPLTLVIGKNFIIRIIPNILLGIVKPDYSRLRNKQELRKNGKSLEFFLMKIVLFKKFRG